MSRTLGRAQIPFVESLAEAAILWEQLGTQRFFHTLKCEACGVILHQKAEAEEGDEVLEGPDGCEEYQALGRRLWEAQDDLRLNTKALMRSMGLMVLSI